jgi:hypothetical protein
VIYGEVTAAVTAVLAGVMVPDEDFAPGELDAGSGASDEVLEPDDRRHSKYGARGCHDLAVLFKNFRLTANDEHQRSPDIADVEGFIILVKDKNCVFHPAETSRIRIARFTFAPGTGCNRTQITGEILARPKIVRQHMLVK